MIPRKQRVIGIDICRSFAIIAAMASHSLNASGALDLNQNVFMTGLRVFMQMSPPLFIGLFGSMLHIAYRPKFETGNGGAAVRQLLARSAQCYLLYVLCVLVGLALGDFSVGYALRCILMIGVTPYVDILKFYALMLLFAPAAIYVSTRYRSGLIMLVGVSLIPHIFYPFLSAAQPPPFIMGRDYLNFPVSFLYGGAPGAGGPSLLHGFYFVFVGMLIGQWAEMLLSKDARLVGASRRSFSAILLISGVTAAALWNWADPLLTIRQIADMGLRNDNHPLYFALGTFAMSSAAWVALELYDKRGAKLGRSATFIGSSSLFTFSFGNILIMTAPKIPIGPTASVAYGALLLVMVILLSWTFKRSLAAGEEQERVGVSSIFAWFYRSQARIVSAIERLVAAAAKFYAIRMSL